jgi:hypothetical protein
LWLNSADAIKCKRESYVNAKIGLKDAFVISAKIYIGIYKSTIRSDVKIVYVIATALLVALVYVTVFRVSAPVSTTPKEEFVILVKMKLMD